MKNNNGKMLLLLLAGALMLMAGCLKGSLPPAEKSDRIEVVATIFPLADIAGCLGGEKVTVTCLIPAGASPHTFEPTADQVRRCSRADLLLCIGGGLDDWAVKTASIGAERLLILKLADAALQQGWTPPEEPPFEQQAGEPLNPHLWLDPLTVRDYLCPALARAMVKADPQNESFYRANLAAYQRELTALDEAICADLGPVSEKSFISIHAAWGYYAARYGLDQAAVITDFPGQEPSAAWMTGLVDLCRTRGVGVVAAEPQLSPAAAEMIASEIDGRVILLDPLGGSDLPQRDSYLNLMRYNTAVLKDAFSE